MFYGLLLNKNLAMAVKSVSVAWGIQATLTGVPNLLMFEAESEFGGEDAGHRMNQAIADKKLQEGLEAFQSRFGGNGVKR